MTAQIIACHDLAKNEADLKRMRELITTFQSSATPTSLLLPWFPSPSRKAKKAATTELFTMLYTYVETRRRTELTKDAIDIMIVDGETTERIVGASPAPKVSGGSMANLTVPVCHGLAFRWYP